MVLVPCGRVRFRLNVVGRVHGSGDDINFLLPVTNRNLHFPENPRPASGRHNVIFSAFKFGLLPRFTAVNAESNKKPLVPPSCCFAIRNKYSLNSSL